MRAFHLIASCALSFGACVENVQLASDCPAVGPCLVELDGSFVPPPDDGNPGAERVDAGVVMRVDSGADVAPTSDASVPPMPFIRNPSFELSDASVPGAVVTINFLNPDLKSTDISPWYTCQPIGVSDSSSSVTAVYAETGLEAGSDQGSPKVDVQATNGRTFITISYLVKVVPMPLLQNLSQPLQEGQRYAFVMDVLTTSPEAQLSVEVRANENGCLGAASQTKLYKSDPVTSQSWTKVCVNFVAPADLSTLILAAESNPDLSQILLNGELLGGPRLFFDNIREATSADCPGL